MPEFFHVLFDPNVLFLRYALLLGVISSVTFGIMSTYIVIRRISYIAGAISHCILGGIGAGMFLQKRIGLGWITPLYGAIVAALLAAIIIGCMTLYGRQREDSAIGAIWAIGMAVGLLFIAKTPGYVDPMSYLFGNILLISKTDIWAAIILDILIIGMVVLFYRQFLAVCFDEEFAKLRGVKVVPNYLLLLSLIALTIVLLVRVVGIIMVIAMLTLPATLATMLPLRLWQIMALSSILCMCFNAFGLCFSYVYDLPTGPTIIVILGAVYFLSIAGKYLLEARRS